MKAKLIMLETAEKGVAIIRSDKPYVLMQEKHSPYSLHKNTGIHTFYNFYLTDPNAEIKDGDNYYWANRNEINSCSNPELMSNEDEKIIASTVDWMSDPKLSKQSIKLLIDYYNTKGRMPDEVEVEYEKGFLHCKHCGAPYPYEANDGKCATCRKSGLGVMSKSKIKLNPQGKVDITIPEEKMYSREEVKDIAEKFAVYIQKTKQPEGLVIGWWDFWKEYNKNL